MIYGYIRVSTDKQTVENQRFEINEYCRKNSFLIDDWIEETISGVKNPNKRALGRLLSRVEKGDIIICSELSRFGRSLLMIMSILNVLLEKGVCVYTIKENYRLGDDIQSKVLAFAFGISAEIERNLISQRTYEALKRKKAMEVRLGRPCGKAKKVKLSDKKEVIQDLLALQISKMNIARIFDISVPTLYRFIECENLYLPKELKKGLFVKKVTE